MGSGCSTPCATLTNEILQNPALCYGESTTAISQGIEDQLELDKVRQTTEIKLLLLGAGEAGKSTILRQVSLVKVFSNG